MIYDIDASGDTCKLYVISHITYHIGVIYVSHITYHIGVVCDISHITLVLYIVYTHEESRKSSVQESNRATTDIKI